MRMQAPARFLVQVDEQKPQPSLPTARCTHRESCHPCWLGVVTCNECQKLKAAQGLETEWTWSLLAEASVCHKGKLLYVTLTLTGKGDLVIITDMNDLHMYVTVGSLHT
jgi:hypothetical protein